MSIEKNIFLRKLIDLPELVNNTIAYVFASNPDINISSRENFFANVISYYDRFKNEKPSLNFDIQTSTTNKVSEWLGRDLRIKNIRLKSVRGFPDSVKPFGFDLMDEKGQPQSLMILGGNAAGKSSIYDAVEYCYCGSIGEARLRSFNEGEDDATRFLDFLEHNSDGVKSIFCHVETMTGFFSIDEKKQNIPPEIRQKLNPDTHFISDYDIYSKGQLDYQGNSSQSFHYTIAQSLGLTELLEFESHIKAFIVYRRQVESRSITALKRSNQGQAELITRNETSITEAKEKLENLKAQISPSLDEANQNYILESVAKLKKTEFSVAVGSASFQSSVRVFADSYRALSTKDSKEIGLSELQFLTAGLELLKEYSDCPFCNQSNLQKEQIVKDVNARITKIQELNELTQKITRAFNNVMDDILLLKTEVDLLRGKIIREIDLIRDDPNFNELFLLDNAFVTTLDLVTAKDFYNELVNLNDNPKFQSNKNLFLFELLEDGKGYLSENIKEFLDTSVVNFNNRRNEIITAIEHATIGKTPSQTVVQQRIRLESDIQNFQRQNEVAQRDIVRDNNKIEELQEVIRKFDEIKRATEDYSKVLHSVLNEEVNKSFAPIKMVVEEVLEEYFKLDNRDVELIISKEPDQYDSETGEILSEIITAKVKLKDSSVPLQSVNKYLNTFHYRLFSTMVSISIAIASRINTKTNMPLVLDDIFYASDFENRVTIESFLTQIFHSFEKYTPDLPLQLILFTHDQIIFESAIKVIKETKHNEISFAKLFPYFEATEEDDFLNLIYEFPEYFPKTLMTSLYLNDENKG